METSQAVCGGYSPLRLGNTMVYNDVPGKKIKNGWSRAGRAEGSQPSPTAGKEVDMAIFPIVSSRKMIDLGDAFSMAS